MFVNTCDIVLPHELPQFASPLTLPNTSTALQVKIVEGTVELIAIAVLSPLHISGLPANVRTGVGLTVTSMLLDKIEEKLRHGALLVSKHRTDAPFGNVEEMNTLVSLPAGTPFTCH